MKQSHLQIPGVFQLWLPDSYGYCKAIKAHQNNQLVEFLRSNRLGLAFRSMIDFSRLKNFRDNALKELRDQTLAIAMLKDIVIPPKGIVETLNNHILGKTHPVKVWDIPYPYLHENPFPVFDSDMRHAVDKSFERVFSSAVTFLK